MLYLYLYLLIYCIIGFIQYGFYISWNKSLFGEVENSDIFFMLFAAIVWPIYTLAFTICNCMDGISHIFDVWKNGWSLSKTKKIKKIY